MPKSNKEQHRELQRRFSYDPATGRFTKKLGGHGRHIGDQVGGVNCLGRMKIYFDGKQHSASRLAFFYMTGSWPKYQIDHINRDTLDDRWINLREATGSQNNANKRVYHKPNSTGYKGVKLRASGKFQAEICVLGKQYNQGHFDTAEKAALAYDQAAKKHFGEFATFNFPNSVHRDWLLV
jgi:hypothetical protein